MKRIILSMYPSSRDSLSVEAGLAEKRQKGKLTRIHSHPINVGLYYDEQKEAAITAGKKFRETRIPKFLDYFEKVLGMNKTGSGYMVGEGLTYADLVVWQMVDGVQFS